MHWPDSETWLFVNTFAPWLSALGSLAAVGMSLYLATFGRRPTISLGISLTTRPDLNREKERQFVRVDATNIGFTDVNIVSIGWEVGLPFLKMRFT